MTVAELPDVLPLVIQHCRSLNIRDLCSVLQVSSSCRQQVQQSRGHCQLDWYVKRSFDYDDDAESLFVRRCEKLQAIATWLVQHAGLVSTLELVDYSFCHKEGQVLQHMLATAFQTCRLLNTQRQAAASAGVAPPQQLQLPRVAAQLLLPPLLLQELAAANLQHLSFLLAESFQSDPGIAACRSGFSCLTSLHSLDFGDVTDEGQLQLPVQHLTQLKELRYALLDPTTVQQLPRSLQSLQECTFQADGSGSCVFDLRHLTALLSLDWIGRERGQAHTAQLPPSLTDLTVQDGLQSISGGQALQHVDLWVDSDAALALLQPLSSLQQPWGLSLHASFPTEVTEGGYRGAAAAIGSATALTRLELDSAGFLTSSTGGATWCPQLVKLPNLRVLSLHSSCQRDDLLRLTALTSLLELHCNFEPPPVLGYAAAADWLSDLDDMVAASLAAALPGLHVLTLRSRSLTKVDLLPALSGLTNLQQLDVHGGPPFKVGDVELMSLSRLTQLSKLRLGRRNWSAEGEAQFLQGMPYLRRIELGSLC